MAGSPTAPPWLRRQVEPFHVAGNGQSALETLPRCRGSDRWILHPDEASTRDNPLGDDRRYDVSCLCLRQAAIMRKCKRQGCEKVLPIDREKLLGSVAVVRP